MDPLRAAAVSIVDGQITHFCSVACRETYLKRAGTGAGEANIAEEAAELPSGQDEETADASLPDSDGLPDGEATPENRRLAPWKGHVSALPALLLPHLFETLTLGFISVAIVLVPLQALGGWLAPLLAIVAVLLAAGLGLWREMHNGPARIVGSLSGPLAGGLLVSAGISGEGRLALLAGVLVCLVGGVGRMVEYGFRFRSGVIHVIAGSLSSLLAGEWRDNSSLASYIRRFAMVLDWARIPVSMMGAVGLLMFFQVPFSSALITGAILLLVLDPRMFRMVTGDAHLYVAIRAMARGIHVRDAHAIHSLGEARIVLFTSPALFEKELEFADWNVADGVDEEGLVSALCALEAGVENRYAHAIRKAFADRSTQPVDLADLEQISGKGLVADSPAGRIRCGPRRLLMDCGLSTGEWESWASEVEESGRRAFFVALGDDVAAVFSLAEKPLPDVSLAVQQLAMSGFEPAMLTSAEATTAISAGDRFGIENVLFERSMGDLESVLAGFHEAGDNVTLVGDGIRFEESVRNAHGAVCAGLASSDTNSLAGVQARGKSLPEVARVLLDARAARSSVRGNLMWTSLMSVVGACLAFGWTTPFMTVVIAGAVALVSAFCTVNGPYERLSRISETVWRATLALGRRLGMVKK